mgnify:CR=1 FL=1
MENYNDNDKEQTVEKDNETVASAQKKQQEKDGHASSITGRPNIDEISKRNEAIANQERKTFYKVAGIIVLLIIAIIFLLYFFS